MNCFTSLQTTKEKQLKKKQNFKLKNLFYICRGVLHDYTTKLAMLNEFILKAMAKSLNLQENCFLNQYGENATMVARYNFYPPCPRPDLALGVKPHADGSAVTFLLQDNEVEGLQVLKDGKWFRVPVVPNALLINAGDQVEVSKFMYPLMISRELVTFHSIHHTNSFFKKWKNAKSASTVFPLCFLSFFHHIS